MEVHRSTTNYVDLDPSALCTPRPTRELLKVVKTLVLVVCD